MKTNCFLLLAALLTANLQTTFAADADLSQLAAADNTFAFKLLKQIADKTPDGNVFISPYSAATALQMTANGAAGQTKTEMQSALEISGLSPATLDAATKAAAGLMDSQDTNLILTTANALWYRQGAGIKPGFLADNQKTFASTIKPLNFSDVPAAEAAINQWASDQTHGRITGIANGLIDPLYTDLVLANAIYFKGKWEDPFEKSSTRNRPFHPATGAAKDMPMMQMSKTFTYRKGSGYQAVRLPYLGGDLAMYVFLPDPGSSPAKLLKIMNGDTWQRVTMPGFGAEDGTLVLPKFKLEDTYDLNGPLAALGMKTAFNRKQADFSGAFSDQHFISNVRQKTFVEVAEEGTEAAAVTIIAMPTSAAIEMPPPKRFEMIVDRPFLFTIVDARSELILFMGVVNEL